MAVFPGVAGFAKLAGAAHMPIIAAEDCSISLRVIMAFYRLSFLSEIHRLKNNIMEVKDKFIK
jgi:hypothetical protein